MKFNYTILIFSFIIKCSLIINKIIEVIWERTDPEFATTANQKRVRSDLTVILVVRANVDIQHGGMSSVLCCVVVSFIKPY